MRGGGGGGGGSGEGVLRNLVPDVSVQGCEFHWTRIKIWKKFGDATRVAAQYKYIIAQGTHTKRATVHVSKL